MLLGGSLPERHFAQTILDYPPDEVLLFRQHDNKPGVTNAGLVGAFGGHIEPTDLTPCLAAVRELREETELDVDGLHLAPLGELQLMGVDKRTCSSVREVIHAFSAVVPKPDFVVFESAREPVAIPYTGVINYDRFTEGTRELAVRYLLQKVETTGL